MPTGRQPLPDDQPIRVLLIEDNEDYAALLATMLERSQVQQFELTHVNNLESALELTNGEMADVVLLDLSLTESHGLNTFYTMHARVRDVPIVVLSGMDDEMVAVEAVRGGAQDYLVKGQADHNLIVRSIRYALERKRAEEALRQSEEHFRSLIENASDLIALLDSERRYAYVSPSHRRVLGLKPENLLGRDILDFIHPDDAQKFIEAHTHSSRAPNNAEAIEFRFRHADTTWRTLEAIAKHMRGDSDVNTLAINARDITERVIKEQELAQAYDATLEGWSRALELRDKETEGHSKRITAMTLKLARVMGMSGAELIHVRRGTLLHDIGKMALPDSILQKGGPLSPEERQIMERHPDYAYNMLAPIAYLRPALDIPYCHHEKWDGSGYPRGLKRTEIPLAARIFAVIDVWDALVSDRPYSKAWTEEQARDYIQAQAGRHFDPQVVKAFLELVQP